MPPQGDTLTQVLPTSEINIYYKKQDVKRKKCLLANKKLGEGRKETFFIKLVIATQ